MKEKLFQPKALRILVCILLVASLATLFLPWETLTIDGKPMGEHLRRLGVPVDAARQMLGNELTNEFGGDGMLLAMDSILTGKTSFVQRARILGKTGDTLQNMTGPMLEIMAESGLQDTEEGPLMMKMLRMVLDWARDEMYLFSGIYWGVMVLMVLLAALAFFCFCKGKRGGMIPYLVLSACLCGITAFGVWQANSLMNLYAELLQSVPDFQMGLSVVGIHSLRNLYGLGCGAWLCVLFAALAFALSFVKPRTPAHEALTETPKEPEAATASDPAPQKEEPEALEAAAPESGEQTQV